MYDVIIIGSGPAGLSAAVYGKRAGLDVLVLELNPMSGGQVLNTYEVDNYLGMPMMNGFDMGMKFRQHADDMGAIFENAQVVGIEEHDNYKTVIAKDGSADKSYAAKTVVLAAGASHAELNVAGEKELKGKGVSYCATCDGAFYRNKSVAVVGGGDVAVEDAIFLARLCEKVLLIHRRDSLRAAKSLQNRLFQCENVEIIWDSVVEEICGQEQVDGVKVRNLKSDSTDDIAVDGVFIAVGLKPNTEIFKNIVPCDERGYCLAGEDCVTKTPGIFAAGDIRTKNLRQIITAAADGANAISSVEKYLLSL
ncbi:MAG: thioredoxin-disulfide reductase [Butyrivibrio sp.]|nr:thioredoxin-disulfide reductase [Butyrivibrio sp.]